ncbi:MAG: hypothetical protein R3B57_12685 [Phycisphaerales bacterium]
MRALLLQADVGADHFEGVDERLYALDIEPVRALDEGAPPRLPEGVRVLVVADTVRLESIAAIRAARAAGVPTLLLMDGIVEWRNTHANPHVDAKFLRPAPVDLVACAGWIDRAILRSMWNDARATGLPRLAHSGERPPLGDRLLIATARRPAFSEAEHERVRWALQRLAHAVERLGVPTTWRIAGRLAEEIGVERDTAPLAESLRRARAVMTTVSTLMIEAMGAGRPTAIIHPHDSPLWHPALWVWRASSDNADPAPVIENLFEAEHADLVAQDRTLAMIHRKGDAAARLARTIAALAQRAQPKLPHPLPSFARPLTPTPTARGALHRLCVIDGTPISPDDASERARRRVPTPPHAQPARTLIILTDPRAPSVTEHDRSPHQNEYVISLDPLADHTHRLQAALDVIERLAPERLDPGPTDLGRALGTLWNASRGRPPERADHALRLSSLARWNKPWADDADGARRWIIHAMRRCGARRIAPDRPAPGDDAVLIEGEYFPETHERVRALRRAGLAAAVSPALVPAPWVVGAIQLGNMVRAGARRLAVYAAGAHTRRLAPLFARDLPILAVLDDAPRERELHARPVMTPGDALARLSIDGVLISSDSLEPTLWHNTEPLRRAGVRVACLYGAGGPDWLEGGASETLRRSA